MPSMKDADIKLDEFSTAGVTGTLAHDYTAAGLCAIGPATGNITFRPTGVKRGQIMLVSFTQDGVGGRTLTLDQVNGVAVTVVGVITPAAGAAAVTGYALWFDGNSRVYVISRST